MPTGSHQAQPRPALSRPTRVDVWKVRAVIPCFNRPADLDRLLLDLAALELDAPGGISLDPIIVDNASDPPLLPPHLPPAASILRLSRNTGGSGGFNAGLREALSRGHPGDSTELLWLIDSDARPEPDALRHLVAALDAHPDLAAVGSALLDPASREVYEVGGRVNCRHGELEIAPPTDWPSRTLVEADYLAACSLLVRRKAVEIAGLLPDTFLVSDDVGWCIRLARRTGGRLACVPASRVAHPHPDRMRTLARYHAARNAFGPMRQLALGPLARFRRAAREIARGATQTLVGRDDLARLHTLGLRDARRGLVTGPGTPPAPDGFEPFDRLPDRLAPFRTLHLDEQLRDDLGESGYAALLASIPASCAVTLIPRDTSTPALLARRLLSFRARTAALVSARARARDWLAGPVCFTCVAQGFHVHRSIPVLRAARSLARSLAALPDALRLTLRPPPLPPTISVGLGPPTRTLSILILSYNRRDALRQTLRSLLEDPTARDAEILVADNASDDASPEMVRSEFPTVRLVALDRNLGVEGFNRAAWYASGEFLLILDDDARPAPGALRAALAALRADPAAAALTLLPIHPATRRAEWPFATHASERFPIMGCANLVRAAAWRAVGGYEPAFFLYRNDVDLALSLLGSGRKVLFDPALFALHDSPAAARKSPRWFRLATRNWVWLARRHATGRDLPLGILTGWLRAHHLAGLSIPDHVRILRGLVRGLLTPPPEPTFPVDGSDFASLLRLRLKGRR